MIEPIISLAFSIYSNKGNYALLIGSGVSRGAAIPTGWEVVLDLIRKLALAHDESCEPDPAAWYKDKYGEYPDYSKLLESICKTPQERKELLRGYFEPTDDEREQGKKIPTDAHKAIAGLVYNGYIRVIITTNFDKLLEISLEEKGIRPIVISTPDAIKGAPPISQNQCFILKVHGDYLDARIKNTPDELSKYPPPIKRLLGRVLDEFGLIVCGWSAEWDIALRAAIEGCKSRRYTTFWTSRGAPKEEAKKLIELRKAEEIRIEDANSFFRELGEKVSSLEDLSRPHPLSPKIAVATAKKYLAEDKYDIPLHDLTMKETEQVYQELNKNDFSRLIPDDASKLFERVRFYQELVGVLQSILIIGCYWGKEQHKNNWIKSLERIANQPGVQSIISHYDFRNYPTLILLYSAGIAAISNAKYDTLASLLTQVTVRARQGFEPIVLNIFPGKVMTQEIGRKLPGKERLYLPLNDYLRDILRETFREIIPQDERYYQYFNRFEYFFGLIHVHLREKERNNFFNGPLGLFTSFDEEITKRVGREIEAEGNSWPLLQAGLFDKSVDRLLKIKNEYDKQIRNFPD